MTLKIYHVILHRLEDLDAFYADMETPGGYLHIPDRAVDYAARLPFSKVTAYKLTEEEAEHVKQDPRVKAVEPALEEFNISAEPAWTDIGTFRKDLAAINNTDQNWALWQCTQSEGVTNFGTDGTAFQDASVTVNSEGLNVDVIVVDGTPNLDHPEFAVNADGTGGSRIIQYNWFQHTDSVTGGIFSNGNWNYTINSLGDSSNNNHGAHVMGTVAGNTQGWARKANLYTISPYSSNYNWTSSGVSSSYVLDYVRAFHRNKPVNPETGRKNPTIINNSWGYSYGLYGGSLTDVTTDIEKVVYRGTTYNEPFTAEQIFNFGLPAWWSLTRAYRDAGLDLNNVAGIPDARTANISWFFESPATKTLECIDDGIIVVSAAGNNSQYLDSENGPDYNNKFYLKSKTLGATRAYYQNGDSAVFYHKGAAPGVSSICVGNASVYQNNQRDFSSNFGPRMDIFAPGNEIISAIRFNGIYDKETTDSRNASYYLGQISGTSMASPQVCGVLACALENNPDMTQADAVAYLQGNAYKNIMFDSSLDWGDVTSWSNAALYALTTDLKNTANYYLRYREERYTTGVTVPKINDKARPTTGVLWPRPKIVKTRRSLGDVIYPSPSVLEAPAESLLTYVGDLGIGYVTVETYVNDSTGLDYSPSYASDYIGDFTANYTGDYLGDYLVIYQGGAGTDFTGSSYASSYDNETAGGGAPVDYLGTYIEGEASYEADYSTYITSYDVLSYDQDVSVYTSTYGVYEGAGFVGGGGGYTPGSPLGYIGAYTSIDSAGGGEIIVNSYISDYIATYTSGAITNYLASYQGNVTETYTGNFTAEFVGSGALNSYASAYTSDTLENYTGNFGSSYIGTNPVSMNVTHNGAVAYQIDSESNPSIVLEKGTTYTFNLNVSGHPFWIKTARTTGTGDQFNTGVTNNGAETGTLTFTPDSSAPSTLYYQCQLHANMGGTINIVNAGQGVSYVGDFIATYTGGYTTDYIGNYNA